MARLPSRTAVNRQEVAQRQNYDKSKGLNRDLSRGDFDTEKTAEPPETQDDYVKHSKCRKCCKQKCCSCIKPKEQWEPTAQENVFKSDEVAETKVNRNLMF